MIEMHDYGYHEIELYNKACERCRYCARCECGHTPELACSNIKEMDKKYKGKIRWHELIVGIKPFPVPHHVPVWPEGQESCPINARKRECL